jgi:hypothetical protein
LKILKAGSLVYEDGSICIDGWVLDAEGGNPTAGEVVAACLEYIAEERGVFATTQDHAKSINAERLMCDCIQHAKEKQ